MDILPWANLYKFYKHKNYSPAEDHRAFRAWTGIHPSVAEKIFTKYQHPCLPDRTRLLIVLHFLKDMPSEEEGSSRFQLTRNTYRKYLWSSIEYLDYKMDEIDIEDRFSPFVPSSGVFKNVSLIVDGTDCAVDRPSHRADRNYLSNGRHKENTYGRYNLKYTVACQVCTGKICYVFGPEGGSVADITSLRNGELVSIITSYDPLEIVLADKGYQGLNSCLSPHKEETSTPSKKLLMKCWHPFEYWWSA